MDDGSPTLEVGFAIETGGSFDELMRLQTAMDSVEGKIIADAARIENATSGMVKLGGATASITSFGGAASREMANIAKETNRAEKAGEAMARQLQRQAETFGKTSSEIRVMRAEMRALAAEDRGLTELAGRIRAASAEMDRLEASTGGVGVATRRSRGSMMQFSMQLNDVATMAALGAPPMQIFASQIGQIVQVAQMAEGGVRGFATEVGNATKAVLLFTVTNPILLGIAATVALVAGSIKMLQNAANDGADMEKYAASLGLTAKEIRNLDNVTVTYGDTAKAVFQVAGQRMWETIGPAVTGIWETMKDWIAWIGTGVKTGVNYLVGGFLGAYNAITKTWESFPAVMGDVFFSSVNLSITAINALVQKAVDGLNFFIGAANSVLEKVGLQLPELSAPQIEAVNNQYAGAFAKFGETAQAEMRKALDVDYMGNVAGDITAQAIKNAQGRIKAQALDKGYLDPEKSKATKQKISDEQKAYERALKAANEYISAVETETARIGKSAKEIRLMEDAIQRLNAPLDAQKIKIDQVAAAREAAYSTKAATDFNANVLQPLRDELALYGLVGPARDAAALALEKQSFLAENMDDGLAVATARWEEYYRIKSELIGKDVTAEREIENARRLANEFDRMLDAADRAADGVARAFGSIGSAIADVTQAYTDYANERRKIAVDLTNGDTTQAKATRASAALQLSLYGDLAEGAKGFFDEKSKAYAALAAAEKAYRAVQFAMSIRAMVQDVAETFSSVASSGARATAAGAEGVAKQAKLPFPANIAAMAATAAALIAAGVSMVGGFGGGGSTPPVTNTGTGTVLGDTKAQSDSIKRSIDALREVDTIMLSTSRGMAASLRSIDSQIGGVAALVVRAGNVDASTGVTEGFKPNLIGSVLGNIPLIGGFLSSLFGSSTNVIGSGLYGKSQSVGSILNGGFDAQYYSDIEKKSKFLGITTGTSRSTQYTGASAALESQFTLIMREFNNAIVAAAGPLGRSTDEITQRLNGFVVNIGKIDTKGLSGEQIQEKLAAVFGATADRMASAAFPGIEKFQKVGEGAFETLVRVASTVEAVTASLSMLGTAAQALGIDAKMALAAQFESVGDFTSAAQTYFERFYTPIEQAQARLAQFGTVFADLGVAMPSSLAAFRQLVEAQDLTTAAGQATYATLLQLAPAFADLQEAMAGVKSAADIASERQDLLRELLELQGDKAAIRAADLANLDSSNRALQEQIWAIRDAQEAAQAADELRKAWTSVGDSIMDEVKRIRGITGAGNGGFASLTGQFNAANEAARGGDQEAAKSLPALSQALLNAAAEAATSRQELDRIQAQTAASLEATYAAIERLAGDTAPGMQTSNAAILNAAAGAQQNSAPAPANDDLIEEIRTLRAEIVQMRSENNAGHAATAGNTGAIKRKFEDVTSASGGDAISTVAA